MAGLMISPTFHTAILSTLREGIIHLALPEPEIAQRSDFTSLALRNLLGVSEDDSFQSQFGAASDFIRFAARHVQEPARPAAWEPIWQPGRRKSDDSLIVGVLRFLEDCAAEAKCVLSESSFQLSRDVWLQPYVPEYRSVLLDQLEERGLERPGQKQSLDLGLKIEQEKDQRKKGLLKRELEVQRISFSKSFRNDFKTASVYGIPMGFVYEARIWRDHARMIRRLQLVPETRFLRSLDLTQHSYIPGLPKGLFENFPRFFLHRLESFGWGSNYFLDIPEIAVMLPRSRISAFDLNCTRLDDEAAKAVADALPKSKITTLMVNEHGLNHSTQEILEEATGRSGIVMNIT